MKSKAITPEAIEASPVNVTEEDLFQLDREIHIVISGKVYMRSEIPEEVQRIISTVNFADQEIATAEQNLQLYKYGRDRMVADLISAVEESDIQAIAESKPAEEE